MASEADSGAAGDQPDRSIHIEPKTLPIPELTYYDMSKDKIMVIFNHYDYVDKYPESRKTPDKREGTARDVAALESTFGSLNFQVKTHHDKTHDEILRILKNLCELDHRATSCVCVCVLTHGWTNGQLCARDKMYNLGELISLLQNYAPGLVGKPKLVVVQACRGGLADAGQTRVDGHGRADWLPSHADTLVLRSSVEDFKSFRSVRGSWLIQEFCRVVAARRHLDVLQIITLVTDLVARERSFNPGQPIIHNKKQTPEVRSTLSRLLRLVD